MFINSNAGTFTLSGNPEIATLTLDKALNSTYASITIGEGFTGVVSALNMRVNNNNIQTVVDQWTTGNPVPSIIKGVTDASVLNRFTLGRFLGSGTAARNISPDYKLDFVGGEVRLVWQ